MFRAKAPTPCLPTEGAKKLTETSSLRDVASKLASTLHFFPFYSIYPAGGRESPTSPGPDWIVNRYLRRPWPDSSGTTGIPETCFYLIEPLPWLRLLLSTSPSPVCAFLRGINWNFYNAIDCIVFHWDSFKLFLFQWVWIEILSFPLSTGLVVIRSSP